MQNMLDGEKFYGERARMGKAESCWNRESTEEGLLEKVAFEQTPWWRLGSGEANLRQRFS